MRGNNFWVLVFCVSVIWVVPGLMAEGNGSTITAPWDELKKLLHVNQEEIVLSLDSFQKLIVLTGEEKIISSFIQDGMVTISRKKFQELINKLESDNKGDDNFEYVIIKSEYSGKMDRNSVLFSSVFLINKSGNSKTKVPLLYDSVALNSVEINGKQVPIVTEDGFHKIILKEPGEYAVNASFSMRYSSDKGAHKFDIPIIRTPITLFNVDLPFDDIDIEIPQAQQLKFYERGGRTFASGVLNAGEIVNVHWRKKYSETEKSQPKVYSETYSLISFDDNSLKNSIDINYNILHSEIDEVSLLLADDITIMSVIGDGIGEWQEIEKESSRILRVPFTYGKKGNVNIRIEYEKSIPEGSSTIFFSGIKTINTERETGFVCVESNNNTEVNVLESAGLEGIAIHNLPQIFNTKTDKPIISSFKYMKQSYTLQFDIEKHERISLPVAVINQANIITMITEDGKMVFHLTYHVNNYAKQFLEVSIPDGAEVWSVFAGDNPVESVINKKGELMVPLGRSKSEESQFNSFPVEIIYCVSGEPMNLYGKIHSSLPSVDLFISRILWSVYLPDDFWYINFNSTLEKEEMITPIKLFLDNKRIYNKQAMDRFSTDIYNSERQLKVEELEQIYSGNNSESSFRNFQIDEQLMNSQYEAEIQFNRRLNDINPENIKSGFLPVHIEIPAGGQVFRFAGTIVNTDNPLELEVFYADNWIKGAIKIFICFFIFLTIFLLRKIILGLFKNILQVFNIKNTTIKSISDFFKSWITLVAFGGLFLVSIISFSSGFITIIIFVLFLLSIISRVKAYTGKNIKKEIATGKDKESEK